MLAPRLAGSSQQLTRTRPTISGQQTGDPLDLGYATTVIATNIELYRRKSADQ